MTLDLQRRSSESLQIGKAADRMCQIVNFRVPYRPVDGSESGRSTLAYRVPECSKGNQNAQHLGSLLTNLLGSTFTKRFINFQNFGSDVLFLLKKLDGTFVTNLNGLPMHFRDYFECCR